jgi:hypothetical protein
MQSPLRQSLAPVHAMPTKLAPASGSQKVPSPVPAGFTATWQLAGPKHGSAVHGVGAGAPLELEDALLLLDAPLLDEVVLELDAPLLLEVVVLVDDAAVLDDAPLLEDVVLLEDPVLVLVLDEVLVLDSPLLPLDVLVELALLVEAPPVLPSAPASAPPDPPCPPAPPVAVPELVLPEGLAPAPLVDPPIPGAMEMPELPHAAALTATRATSEPRKGRVSLLMKPTIRREPGAAVKRARRHVADRDVRPALRSPGAGP